MQLRIDWLSVPGGPIPVDNPIYYRIFVAVYALRISMCFTVREWTLIIESVRRFSS
jgi:hypothetical protein